MPLPRVFVSSVVEGFGDVRATVRRGVLRGGGEPVLVNEDHAADSRSSRNACLDAVASCDAYFLIIGERGGWTTPSGKLVVEEEYEQALALRLPVFVFIQDGAHDADASRLINRVSDYIDGRFRRSFASATQLEQDVAAATGGLVSTVDLPMTSASDLQQRIVQKARIPNEPVVRVVLSPERSEEVVHPAELMKPAFARDILRLGHDGKTPLLDYARPKSPVVRGDTLAIEQTDPESRHGSADLVRLAITERGVIEMEANVVPPPGDGNDPFGSGMVVRITDIERRLHAMFGFAASFYDSRDPYKRHHRLLYNAALLGLGYRKLTRQALHRGAYTMNMTRGDGAIVAFTEPRLVSRDQLVRPSDEIDRIIAMFERADQE